MPVLELRWQYFQGGGGSNPARGAYIPELKDAMPIAK